VISLGSVEATANRLGKRFKKLWREIAFSGRDDIRCDP